MNYRNAFCIVALGVGLIASACQSSEPAPAATPKIAPAQVEPPPPPKVEPPPPPEPEPPPPLPVPEGCKIIIEGGEPDDAVKRALINTKAGGLYDTVVVDGKEIQFECPPVEERAGANVIAEKANAELVHWPDVELGPEAGDQALAVADAKPDLPEGLDEETLARLRAKWPDLAKWEQDKQPAAEAGPDTPAPVEEKVPVAFSAHQLYWAELRIEPKAGKGTQRAILDPKATKSLAPGSYELSIKREEDGRWEKAGTLEIVAGQARVSVQMLDNPPRAQIVGK